MNNRLFRREPRGFWADAVHALMISLLVFPAGLAFLAAVFAAQSIETRYFPVLTPIHIIAVRPVPGGTLIEAEAVKLRFCSLRQMLWYFGTRDGLSVPLGRMEDRGNTKLNGIGKVHWDNLFIPVPIEQINNTFGDAYHDCWPWGWWTRSQIHN